MRSYETYSVILIQGTSFYNPLIGEFGAVSDIKEAWLAKL